MKVFFATLLALCIDRSFGACATDPVVLSDPNERISVKKCKEYKELIAETYYVGGGGLLPWSCNVRSKKQYKCNAFTGLIVGGEITKPGEFPHMAAIGWKRPDGNIEFKCGGSLISDRFVLTVAHCATDVGGNPPTTIRLGDQNLAKNDDADPKEYKVKNVTKHKKYSHRTKENDIALIELDKNVTAFTTFIRPACIHQELKFTGTVVATGWGKTTTYSPTSDELLKVALNTTDNRQCFDDIEDDIPSDRIYPTQICAGGERNKDTCQGDSGGPIQISKHEDAPCVYTVVGMTSYGGVKCGSKLPSVYTRVARYVDWIEENVWP